MSVSKETMNQVRDLLGELFLIQGRSPELVKDMTGLSEERIQELSQKAKEFHASMAAEAENETKASAKDKSKFKSKKLSLDGNPTVSA